VYRIRIESNRSKTGCLFRLFGWVVGRVESLELDWDSGMPFAAVVAVAKLQDNIVGGMEPVLLLVGTACLGWGVDLCCNRVAEEDLEALHRILAVELNGILVAELNGILVAELYGILAAELYGILAVELYGIRVAELCGILGDHRVAVEEFALYLEIEHYLLSFHVFGGS
jgi:hypothetical protein